MLYKVKIKRPFGLFWKTYKNVQNDTIIETEKGIALPVRVLYFPDESRLEVPMSYQIWFSKERAESIRAAMKKERGE